VESCLKPLRCRRSGRRLRRSPFISPRNRTMRLRIRAPRRERLVAGRRYRDDLSSSSHLQPHFGNGPSDWNAWVISGSRRRVTFRSDGDSLGEQVARLTLVTRQYCATGSRQKWPITCNIPCSSAVSAHPSPSFSKPPVFLPNSRRRSRHPRRATAAAAPIVLVGP